MALPWLLATTLPDVRTPEQEGGADTIRQWLQARDTGPPEGERILALWERAGTGIAVTETAVLAPKEGRVVVVPRSAWRGHRVDGPGRVILSTAEGDWAIDVGDEAALDTFLSALVQARPTAAVLGVPESPAERHTRYRVHGREAGALGFGTVLDVGAAIEWLSKTLGSRPVVRAAGGGTEVELDPPTFGGEVASTVIALGMARLMAQVLGFGIGFGPRIRPNRYRFTLTPYAGGTWVRATQLRGGSWLPLSTTSAAVWQRLHDRLWEAEATAVGLAPPPATAVGLAPPPATAVGLAPRPATAAGLAPRPATRKVVASPPSTYPAPSSPPRDGRSWLPAVAHLLASLLGIIGPFVTAMVWAAAVLVFAGLAGEPRRAPPLLKAAVAALAIGTVVVPIAVAAFPVADFALAGLHLVRRRESSRSEARLPSRARAVSGAAAALQAASLVVGNLTGPIGAALVAGALWLTRGDDAAVRS